MDGQIKSKGLCRSTCTFCERDTRMLFNCVKHKPGKHMVAGDVQFFLLLEMRDFVL